MNSFSEPLQKASWKLFRQMCVNIMVTQSKEITKDCCVKWRELNANSWLWFTYTSAGSSHS